MSDIKKIIVKNQFAKPKYIIYLVLVLLVTFWFLHMKLTLDVQAKDIGTLVKQETIKEKEFEVYGQLTSKSFLEKEWFTEVYFYDTTQLFKDIIFAVDCDEWSLKSISCQYSYELDGIKFVESLSDDDFAVRFNTKAAIGGIAIRQPFPKKAKNRRLILFHTTENTNSSLIYIAIGSQLHNCDITKGIEESINAKKRSRFGKINLFKLNLVDDLNSGK